MGLVHGRGSSSAALERAILPFSVRGRVEFEHVVFGYVPEKTVLHDVTL